MATVSHFELIASEELDIAQGCGAMEFCTAKSYRKAVMHVSGLDSFVAHLWRHPFMEVTEVVEVRTDS